MMNVIRTVYVSILLSVISFGLSASDDSLVWKEGVLKTTIKDKNRVSEYPGQKVFYAQSDKRGFKVHIRIGEKEYQDRSVSCIIPLDPEFTVSRMLLRLLELEKSGLSNLELRFYLAKNILDLFPKHPLREEVFASLCRFAPDYSWWVLEEKGSKTAIELLRQFLAEYPRSQFAPIFKWRLFSLEVTPYGMGEHLPTHVETIRKYESYLKNHPSLSVREEIKMVIARQYRAAFESLQSSFDFNDANEYVGHEDSGRRVRYTLEDCLGFRENAINIYEELLDSADLKTREIARAKLYNIRNGRHVATGWPSDW